MSLQQKKVGATRDNNNNNKRIFDNRYLTKVAVKRHQLQSYSW